MAREYSVYDVHHHCFPACALWRTTGSFAQGEWLRGRCAAEHPPRERYAHIEGFAGHVCNVDDDLLSMVSPSPATLVNG